MNIADPYQEKVYRVPGKGRNDAQHSAVPYLQDYIGGACVTCAKLFEKHFGSIQALDAEFRRYVEKLR